MTKGNKEQRIIISIFVILGMTVTWLAYQSGKATLQTAFAEEQVWAQGQVSTFGSAEKVTLL